MIEQLSRRKLIGGLGLLIAAPAIVRASSLMSVKAFDDIAWLHIDFPGANTVANVTINGNPAYFVQGSMDGKKWFEIPQVGEHLKAGNLNAGRYYRLRFA